MNTTTLTRYNKTLRNKAIRQMGNNWGNRLIVADYKGKTWSSPNGYFAINIDIYSDYKTLKNDEHISTTCSLNTIIDDALENAIQLVTRSEAREEIFRLTPWSEGEVQSFQWLNDEFKVNKSIYDFILNVYPDAQIWVGGNSLKPVVYKVDDEIVAIQMPVRY